MFNLWIARLFEQLDLNYLLLCCHGSLAVHRCRPFQCPYSITLSHPILNFHCYEFSVTDMDPFKGCKNRMSETYPAASSWYNRWSPLSCWSDWLKAIFWDDAMGSLCIGQWKLKVHCPEKSNDQQSWPNYHLCFPAILGRRLGTWLIHSVCCSPGKKILPSLVVVFANKSTCLIGWFMNFNQFLAGLTGFM